MHLLISICGLFLLLLQYSATKEAKCGTATDASSTCTCQNRIMDCRGQHIDTFPKTIDISIEAVYLNDNDLTSLSQLPEEASLKTLSMANNKIDNLTYDTFDNLDGLTTLILSNNSISTIVDDIFEWNPLKLQVLHLDGNKMEFVQHFLFYDLEELTTLHLQRNKITFIHPHAFLQLKNLRNLRLEENQLHTFNPKWIQKLASNAFMELRFHDNPWQCDCAMNTSWVWLGKEKSAKWFKDLTTDHPLKCKKPDKLAGQYIEKLSKEQVEEKCDRPVITGISAKASITAGRDVLLRCVADVEKTPVPQISWTAPNGDVYRLNTAANFEGIVVHQDGSLLIKNLSKSDDGEYSCDATNIVGTFTANTHITVLDAPKVKPATPPPAYTKAAEKPDDTETAVAAQSCPKMCQCVSKHVDCASDGSNPKSEVPSGIPTDSVSISFASNALKSLEANTFKDHTDLEELRLDDNKISSIAPDAFTKLSGLMTLTLRKNELTDIRPRTFEPLTKLNVLVLDENKLTKLQDDTFVGLKNVHWLYVRNNVIQSISDLAFKPLENIKFIHLEGNQLQVLYLNPVTTLTNMKPMTINKIFVDDNNFDCNCHMEELRQFVRSDDSKKKYPNLFADGVVCTLPSTYNDHHLEDISAKLECTKASTETATNPDINAAEEKLQEYIDEHQKQDSSSYSGLLFGGIALGIILTIVLFILWRKYGRRARTAGRQNYSSLNGADEAERRGLTDNLGTSGSEAFV